MPFGRALTTRRFFIRAIREIRGFNSRFPRSVARSEELAGAGFGQAHEVFDFQVVVEFGFFFGGECCRFLALDEIPDALAGRLGRLEVNQLTGTKRGDELNQFFVGFTRADSHQEAGLTSGRFSLQVDDAGVERPTRAVIE